MSSDLPSLPSRERGLKSPLGFLLRSRAGVAPLAGAWVEIIRYIHESVPNSVAPLAGAWVEILYSGLSMICFVRSLPSRERGLKFKPPVYCQRKPAKSLPSRERGLKCRHVNVYSQHVAPLVGARIEIR